MILRYFGQQNIEMSNDELDTYVDKLLPEGLRNYHDMISKDNVYNNIFSVLHKERDEAHVHSNIIFWILRQPVGTDGSYVFLDLFLKRLGIDNEYLCDKWTPFRERYFDDGRIDFVLESIRFCAAIEMKIDAYDGIRQLERYELFCKRRNKEYLVFYLTLNGKEPSEGSMGNMDRSKLRLISFENTIGAWLEDCMACVEPSGYMYSFLKQYFAAVQQITQGEDIDKMKDYITDTKTAIASMFIANNLFMKMEKVLVDFMSGLECLINAETELVTYLEKDKLETYYTGSKKTSGLYIVVDSIKRGSRECCFVLKAEIDSALYLCFGFVQKHTDSQYEWMDLKQMKEINPAFYQKWVSSVESLNLLDVKRSAASIWIYLNNSNGERLDFGNLGLPVLELIDDMDVQLEYIGDIIVNQIIKKLTA